MEFNRIHARYPEKKGFSITRIDTGEEFIFLHFLTPGVVTFGGKDVELRTGACLFFPKHATYTVSARDCNLLHDWFHARGNIDTLLAEYGLEFEKVYYPAGHEFVTELITAIETERSMDYPFAERLCALFGEQLIAKIARFCAQSDNTAIAPETYKTLCEIREKLHASLSDDWTVEKMAAEINLSPSYFHSLYKAAFGCAPKHDLLRIRLRHAKSLLIHSNLNISEVAEQSGFGTGFHFIRSFRSAFGITPNQYRISKKK